MEYGIRDFKGVGFVIEEPEVSVDRKDNQWCKLIVSFDQSENPEYCFEIVAKNEAVSFAKTLKVNDSVIVSGSIFSQKERINPKERVYACNDITLLANKLIKIQPPKRYFLKTFIYGIVSKDPELLPFKSGDGALLSLLVRVNYTWMKGENKENDTHFFNLKAFNKMAKKGHGELAQGDYCFLECSLKRSLKKEGNWPDFIINWIDH